MYNWSLTQYPPAICINQQPDGTVNYSGSSIDVIKYAEEALNIRFSRKNKF